MFSNDSNYVLKVENGGTYNGNAINAWSGGNGYGIYSFSQNGVGIYGYGLENSGVKGFSKNSRGGYFNSMEADGLYGLTSDGDSCGVFGENNTSSGNYGPAGVRGQCDYSGGYGVKGISENGTGAYFETYNSNNYGAAVYGNSLNTKGLLVQGYINCYGDIYKNGYNCYFVRPYLKDNSKIILYGCLEGPECGNYIRGKSVLDNGEVIIELPDHFGMVTAEIDLTVQLTPFGGYAQLYVDEISTNKLVVRREPGYPDVEFFYSITGIRKGEEDHKVICNGDFLNKPKRVSTINTNNQ